MNITDYGERALEISFDRQKEAFEFFSDELMTSSLSISFSTVFHLIMIYLMMKQQIFKRITQCWNSGLLKNRIVIIICVLVCFVINISRYMMCLDNSNTWINFVQRLLVVSIWTPTSILLEWTCLRLYYSYLTIFQYYSTHFSMW